MRLLNRESGGFLRRFILIILVVIVATFILAIFDPNFSGDSQIASDCAEDSKAEEC